MHQPILFGLVSLLATIAPPQGESGDARFFSSCQAQCEGAGQPNPVCSAACTCLADELREQALWARTIANQLQTAERKHLGEMARSCLREKRRLNEE